MAFGKLAQINKEMKTVGVAGADKGVGTTHLCLTIAGLLKQNNFRVAILEANSNASFQEIAENLEIPYNAVGFEYQGIDYYFKNPNTSIATIKSEGYDYLIIDMGTYAKCDKSIFTMAMYNIIVASARYWNFSSVIENVCNDQNSGWEDYIYVFPFAKNNKTVQKELKDALNVPNIYFPEYNENPFRDFDVPEINEMLSVGNIEVVQPAKSIFGGWKKKSKPLIRYTQPAETTEPELEEFEEPDNKLSIDDLKDVTDSMIKSNSTDALVQVLADKEFEEASKKYAPESTSPIMTPTAPKKVSTSLTPVLKPDPIVEEISEPEPVEEITTYKEEAGDIQKTAEFIGRAVKFDVIKNNVNKDILAALLNKTTDAANKLKERNE